MTYVIGKGCVNDASCITVCPVDCIRPLPGDPDFATAEQLYIDPQTCTDCSACLTECPVSAIHDEFELPEEMDVFKQLNAELAKKWPVISEMKEAPADAKQWEGVKDKLKLLER